MNRFRPLRHWASESLLRRLLLWMTVTVAGVGLSAAGASYVIGYQEAKELQDVQLRQIALLVHRWGHLPQSVLAPQGADVDEDTRIIVERLGAPALADGLHLPNSVGDGMHQVESGGHSWRVFVQTGRGGRIAVAQSTDVRLDAAINGAQRTLLPLLALIPLLLVLFIWVVRRALQPVRTLADQLDERDEGRLDPLPVNAVPREIRPFLASINRLLDRLAVLLERERRFVADAAHELRTPIAALSLQAENLAHADLPAGTRARLCSMQDGLARTRAVVEQLLSLARAQSGRGLALHRTDPSQLLHQVIEDLMPMAEVRHIDLGMERDEGAPILADSTQLYTLLRNGLDNALRYTPDGGRIDLAVFTEAGAGGALRVNIDIADTGPGIPPQDLQRAFEPFERLEHVPGSLGSGLGLAIMHSIAENLGGRLELENRPTGGLRLRYSQPVMRACPGSDPA
ncbi:MAG TPA: HAMP domain-containing sensor histidine kinase, partial [Candidatus Binataceae bacterium]|nr:HAMP domain-containing sensor histidine kinase [Candidatus Binataceae bacterium]